VLGLDTPAGAYLARLLSARGQPVAGAAVAGPSLLAALGSADDVAEVAAAEAAAAAARAGMLYLVSSVDQLDADPALAAQMLESASENARIVHIVDRALLRAGHPALRLAQQLSAARRAGGRFAANAIFHAHDSRLGGVESLPARLTLAGYVAAGLRSAGGDAARLVLPDSAPQDWGWTPEYVDAALRLGALPEATDIEIGSGVTMTAHAMAGHVARWFKLDPEGWIERLPAAGQAAGDAGAGQAGAAVDSARLKALLGWRAFTTGGELMAALCEAAAERATAPGRQVAEDGARG
jgi:hypothetical protein